MSAFRIGEASSKFAALVRKLPPRITVVRTSFTRRDTPSPDRELLGYGSKTMRGMVPMREREVFKNEFSTDRPRGQIYDKKPFRIELKAEKKYSWCTCGTSKKQPLCDGSHKRMDGTTFDKSRVEKFRPMIFTVEDTKEYFLCNCKQTNNAPFCDGTHKRADIQEAVK